MAQADGAIVSSPLDEVGQCMVKVNNSEECNIGVILDIIIAKQY